MALELPSGADFWCNRRCKTSPVDLEGSRGKDLVALGGFGGLQGVGAKGRQRQNQFYIVAKGRQRHKCGVAGGGGPSIGGVWGSPNEGASVTATARAEATKPLGPK